MLIPSFLCDSAVFKVTTLLLRNIEGSCIIDWKNVKLNVLLPISKMTNDSCILWIGVAAYEQSYDGADEITYIPTSRETFRSRLLLPMKQVHAGH